MSKFLKKPASDKENKTAIEGQAGRDHQALILPLTVIKLKDNIRNDPSDIDDLAESIKTHGLLQPLVVCKENGSFALIAGHRRYQALIKIGAKEAPVRLENVDENQAAVLRLIENIQRQDLSGAEEVLAVAKLSAIFPDQVRLAKAIGKSKSYVSRCLKAAELIGNGKVSTLKLSKSAIFELAYAKDPAAALVEVEGGAKPTVKSVRERSGPVPGGRYGTAGCFTFNERQDGKAFSLRLNVDFERTPPDSRQQIIKALEDILKKLRAA